jgi:hypothetical protein
LAGWVVANVARLASSAFVLAAISGSLARSDSVLILSGTARSPIGEESACSGSQSGAGAAGGSTLATTERSASSRCAVSFRRRLERVGAAGASLAGRPRCLVSSAAGCGCATFAAAAGRSRAAGSQKSADEGTGKPNPGMGSGKLQGSTRRKVPRSGAGMPRRRAFPRTAFAERFNLTPMTSGWIPVCRQRIRRRVSIMVQAFALCLRNGRSWGVRRPSRARLRSSAARVRSR